jgi:hypothetical protein
VPTLSAGMSDVLGQVVVAALVGLVGAVIYLWAANSTLLSRVDGIEKNYARLSSDVREFREFCQSGRTFTNEDGKALREEFLNCRANMQEQLNRMAASPSRFKSEGRQIKAALDDFREVQKDVLHRLRIIEGSVRAMHIVRGIQDRNSSLSPSIAPKTKNY